MIDQLIPRSLVAGISFGRLAKVRFISPLRVIAMFLAPEEVRQAVEDGFGHKRVLVIGDLMLDSYL